MSDNKLLEKLDGLSLRFQEVSTLITDPEVINDRKRFAKLTKEYSDLEKIDNARKRYAGLLRNIDEAREILDSESDPEMREMAREELDESQARIPALEEEIKLLLVPADPQDDRNAILEIRGGTGGDEAALFAGDLFRMYAKYCEMKGWKLEISSASEGAAGGFKEIICSVSGQKVYGTLKYESGVHRVQRVPATETQGRVHTSAASVAVLPEAEELVGHLPQRRRRRTECQQGGVGRASALQLEKSQHGRSRRDSHRVYRDPRPAQEQGTGPLPPPHLHLRQGTPEIHRRHRQQTQDDGIDRRPLGQDTHLQLSARAHHRPPHQLHHLQPLRLHGRRHTGLHRPSHRGRKCRTPERKRTLTDTHL